MGPPMLTPPPHALPCAAAPRNGPPGVFGLGHVQSSPSRAAAPHFWTDASCLPGREPRRAAERRRPGNSPCCVRGACAQAPNPCVRGLAFALTGGKASMPEGGVHSLFVVFVL